MDPVQRGLQCVVVTPERAVLDEPVDFVALPLYDGELGVLPGRAPLIGRLGYGELRIRRGDSTRRFFVDGGFAQVRPHSVRLLASFVSDEDSEAKIDEACERARQALANAASVSDELIDAELATLKARFAEVAGRRKTAGRSGVSR